jgi:hypothetical protein
MKSFLLLMGGSVLLWGILLIPGFLLQGEQVWCQSSTALGLCLVPTMASLAWMISPKKDPEMQMVAILGGTGIRLGVALGGGMALHYLLPDTYPTVFFIWVGAFYLGALTLEVLLALGIKPTAGPSEPTGTLSSAR